MSYHHHNRMLAHWQPKRRPEGASLTWGSKERFEKLSSSAGFVASVVASHLNDETNSYEISIKTLIRETERTKGTIGKALTELVEWGIFTRTRTNKERPYRYSLAVTCPLECEHLAIHNTPSELATLPIKQATPMPKEQETSLPIKQAEVSPENRQLIDSDKQLNKKTDRQKPPVCPSCIGEEYLDKVIHQQACPHYQRLKDWKPWQITQRGNLDKWAQWDYREKQIATFDSLRGFDERQALKSQEELEKFNQMVADQAGEQPLLPKWREWLWLRVQMYPTSKISVRDLRLALLHSEQGQDLEEKVGWRQHPHNQPHNYYQPEALAAVVNS